MAGSQVQERARGNHSAVLNFRSLPSYVRRTVGNPETTTRQEGAKSLELDETTVLLDQTIAEARDFQGVAPSDAVKEILSLIIRLLLVIKDTTKGIEKLRGLVLQCNRAVHVLQPTSRSNGEEAAVFLSQAGLEELKTLVLRIFEDITPVKRKKRWSWSRTSSISIDKIKIDEWITSFDRVLSPQPRFTNSGSTTIDNVPLDILDSYILPRTLFGRSALVEDIARTLLAPRHVLLCGSDGIGKTTISRAILHEPAIRERYKERHFFIQFDDFDGFQMTHELFIDRLLRDLPIDTVSVAREWHIMNFLKLDDILLVLDNIVDVQSPDSGLILNSLTEFGSLPNVTIMMTSQSIELPPSFKLPYLIHHVPPLPVTSIHEAFSIVYKGNDVSSAVEWLSTSNINNALAITILARVADVNKWTAEQLRDAWDAMHNRLAAQLSNPHDLTLACSVEVSLTAPSAKCFRNDIRRAFAVLALLPQGLPRGPPSRVAAFLAEYLDPLGIVELLCKHGLLFPRGAFYVMNPSIRRYMLKAVPPDQLDAGYLKQIRGPYPYILDDPDARVDTFVREDVNVEAMVAFDLTNLHLPGVHLPATCTYVAKFLRPLLKHKPRSTCLRVILTTLARKLLSENRTLEPDSKLDLEPLMKAFTVLSAYHLALGDYAASADLFDVTRDLALAQNDGTVAMECIAHEADACRLLGRYKAAMELIEELRQSDLWVHGTPAKRGFASWVSSMSRLQVEVKPENELFAEAVNHFEEETAMKFSWQTAKALSAFAVGAVSGDWSAARAQLRECLSPDTDDQNQGPYLYGLVPIAFMEGQLEEAQQHIVRAQECYSRKGHMIQVNRMLVEEAMIASHRGQFQEATELLFQAALDLEDLTRPSPSNECLIYYASACNSLFANALADARIGFERVRESCMKRQELHLRAQSVRALGEIAFLNGDNEGATTYFDATAALCNQMGIPLTLLYRCHVLRDLGDKFKGWQTYLRDSFPEG